MAEEGKAKKEAPQAEAQAEAVNTFKGFAIDSEGYFVARLDVMKGVRSKSGKSDIIATTRGKVAFQLPDGSTAYVNLNVYKMIDG